MLTKASYLLIAVTISALALAVGVPDVLADPATLGLTMLAQTAVATLPAAQGAPFKRIREDIAAFDNVVASGRASTEIPRYALTLLRATLQLGGTTFAKSHISEIRLRLGSKVLFFVTGAHLNTINKYKGLVERDNFLTVDFTQPRDKEMGGEFVGGIDMSSLPSGKLLLEVLIAGATAPTLSAKLTWGEPQGNTLLQKLLQFTWSSGSGTGKFKLPLDFRGALVQRVFHIFGAGADICGTTAVATAFATNSASLGAMGTITVSAGAKVGRHQVICVEPASNAGTFIHLDPDGMLVGKGQVASAYAQGGLAFTIADGSTDYAAGDGFYIDVPANSLGNVNRVEVKKNGRVVWDMECDEARFAQQEFGLAPQSRLYVADFLLDKHSDGILHTSDAASLEWNVWLAAADNLTIYAEVLDTPENN